MKARPVDSDEAEKRLTKLASELKDHLDEYQPFETFVSYDLLKWVVDAIDERSKRNGSLDQALGLARYRGEKQAKPGKYFTLAVDVFDLRFRGLSWSAVSKKTGFEDQRELQKICEREMSNVLRHYADEKSARWRTTMGLNSSI